MTTTQRSRIPRDDRGSIPIALLGIIALTSVMGALVANAVGSTRTARFDQRYTEVIQVADAAAQAGANHLIRAIAPSDLQSRTTPATGSGALDAVPYTWTAERRPVTECRTGGSVANCWRVTGVATTPAAAGVDAVTRTVALQVSDNARFFVAAFSDVGMRLRGGNAADSYLPGVSGGVNLGNGIVGSNGTIRLNGNTYVDGVQLFSFAGALATYARCDGRNQAGQCAGLLAAGGPVWPSATFVDPLEVGPGEDLDTAFIDAARTDPARCNGVAPTDWRASLNGGVLGNPTGPTRQVMCVNNLIIDTNTTVAAGRTVEVYVYGTFSTSNDTTLNCSGCTATSRPDSTRLRIYSDGGDVNIGNHNFVAAAIYAPESTCGGNPSNAQAEIFGSLICRDITNQGGWGFHYDEQLRSIGDGDYQMHAWQER
jgi:hypothetical protein